MNYKIIILLVAFLNITCLAQAQQPSDCINAIVICGNSNLSLDVEGVGVQELTGSNDCGSQENNSIWLRLDPITDGTLAFTLTPNSAAITEDYDFFLFGPVIDCNNLGQAVRCSTTNPASINQANNLTGMSSTETDASEGPGANGNSFVESLDVLAGERYFLVIDRPIGNSPFSMEWTGSAQFAEPPANQDVSNATNIENCDSVAPYNDGLTTFDLSVNNSIVLGDQVNVTFSYHETESDANLNTNPIDWSTPYTNIANPQIIFVRVTNENTECFEISEFQLTANFGPDISIDEPFQECDDYEGDSVPNGITSFNLLEYQNEILQNQDATLYNISYHLTEESAENSTSPLPDVYTNTTAFNQVVFVRIAEVGNLDCKVILPLTLEVLVAPESQVLTLTQCDEDGIPEGFTTFNLSEIESEFSNDNSDIEITYFFSAEQALQNSNALESTIFDNFFNPQTLYVRLTNSVTSCFNLGLLNLNISATQVQDLSLTKCDDDGIEDGIQTFNLGELESLISDDIPATSTVTYYQFYNDALIEASPITSQFSNTIPYNQVVYARIENENACYGISEISLEVFALPQLDIEDEFLYCLNEYPTPITLDAGVLNDIPNNYYFEWSTGEDSSEIMVNEPGTYTVNVINTNGCFKSRTIQVLPSNIATFDAIEISDASANNSITILVSGEGDYEFSLNNSNGPYQDSNEFTNLISGFYTVFVRDKNNCGLFEKQVSVIGFPKYFTPNNDSHNDTWSINGVSDDFQPQTKVLIFNRYGKLITTLSGNNRSWDGNYNGNPLPGDDYWFQVILQDGRVFNSHFTLKR